LNQDFLIVDDDQVFAGILCRKLEKRGYSVAVAFDEASALSTCREAMPARIILDLKLEETSGLHLIEQLRGIHHQTRIVILTGYSSIPTTVEAMKLGATNYLCKPASIEDIVAAFENTAANADLDLPVQPPSVERLEWEHIQQVLSKNDGNISATARALGMHRRTLQRKLGKRPVKN
jgi:two-component system, response regulator RegA